MTVCFQRFKGWWLPAAMLLGLLLGTAAWGEVGADIEKPAPTFAREGDRIVAELIPRAKNTAVKIVFTATGGHLSGVEGMDFALAAHPSVNARNFRSALFVARVNAVPAGGEVRVSIASAFFTRATQYFVFNEHLPQPWMDPGAENRSHPQRVQELVVTVRDGGPLDADGAPDGRITLIGGPRDSFWGYAIGTLFIRFFGIFIVLSALMLGMIVSGLVFKRMDAARQRPVVETAPAEPPATAPSPEAAAIALALHLHLGRRQRVPEPQRPAATAAAWLQDGRQRQMRDRMVRFDRRGR